MSLNDRLSSHPSARLSSRVLYAAILVFVCCAMLFLGAPLAQAQSAGSGAITGTVTDASGASVPNVTVTATNNATNQSRSMTTGSDGVYKFSLLTPGTYTLKFSAANFKTAQVTGVTVAVTETQTVDHVLEVGAITEKVTVEANVETIQTESSTLGTTVSGNTITALPLANRNYTQIISLSAGANSAVNNATSLGKGTNDMSVNGNNSGQNNFQMDGVAVNNIASSGTTANDGTIYTGIPIPSPDAIAEFKVQTSTYDASYGRNPGANVNVITKSGTNSFHGTAFEYLRNSVLNADDFFYPKHNPGARPHQVLDQNQFGGTLGGPIKKDKLFFFASYQGTRGKNGVAAAGKTFGAQLPAIPTGDRSTAAVQNAIANVLCLPQYQNPIPPLGFLHIHGPAAGCAPSGNQGPANFSAVGLNILNLKNADGSYYLPSPSANSACAPNAGGNPATDPWTCNFSVPALYSENQYVANGDYVISSKHTLEMRYFYTHNPQIDTLGQAGGLLPGTPENVPWGNQTAVLKFRSIVTNNFVNEARISFQRNLASGNQTMPFLNGKHVLAADIGQTPLNTGNMPQVSIIAIPGYTMFGTLFPFSGPTNQTQLADQISWSHGKHSIRAGFEYEDTRWPLVDRGLELGLGIYLQLNDLLVQSAIGGGNVFQCLFCVKGIDTEKGITHFYKLQNMNGYVLDDWKVNPRLTMNIGLRWEFDGQLSDSFGRLTQVWLDRMIPFGPVQPSFAAALTDPASLSGYVVPSNFAAHFGQPPTGVFTANNNHSIEGHAPYSNFAPRIGFAWQPLSGGKLVLRGGFGLFYDRVGLDLLVHAFEQGYPYAATYDFGPFSSRYFQASTANPYPPIQLVPLPSNPTLGFAPRFAHLNTGPGDPLLTANSGLSTPYVPASIHTPLVREYNLNMQYEFSRGWVLELGYVGTSGINLIDYNHNHNQAILATPTNNLSYLCAGLICNTTANAAFRAPYLGYATAGLQASDFNGRSNYNSLQGTVRHQFAHGLSMQAAYTWSKNLSDVFSSNAANMNSSLDMNQQYGRVMFDRPQRLSVNYSYDLPFGKSATGFAGKLASGWNVAGVTIIQSGNPLTFISNGISGAGYGNAGNSIFAGVGRAQFCSGMGNGNIKTPGDITANLNNYFNPAAFIGGSGVCTPALVPFGGPGAYDYGNSGVGAVLGPGQFNFDMSLMKNTKLTEGVSMQFRTDFYNAFNHPQFSPPTGGYGSAGFVDVTTVGLNQSGSKITNTTVNPRLIQFGLKFIF